MGKVIQFEVKPAYRRNGFAPLPGRRFLSDWGHASQYMLYWDCSIEGSREAGYIVYDRCFADGLTHSDINVKEYRASNGSSLYEAMCSTNWTDDFWKEALLYKLREFDPELAEEFAARKAAEPD